MQHPMIIFIIILLIHNNDNQLKLYFLPRTVYFCLKMILIKNILFSIINSYLIIAYEKKKIKR